jgi:hypothetical protein
MSHRSYQDWLYRQDAQRRMYEVPLTLYSLALAIQEHAHPRSVNNLHTMAQIARRAYTDPHGERYV